MQKQNYNFSHMQINDTETKIIALNFRKQK